MAIYGLKKVFVTALTDVDTVDREGVGTIRIEAQKIYKYVKYNAGTATVVLVAGDVVVYHGDDGWDDSEVCGDYTDGVVVAGVAVAVIADDGFGWIQIGGQATLGIAIETSNDGIPVAAADGDIAVIGDADGAARRDNTVRDADAELEAVIGTIIDASAKKVLLTLPW